MKTKKQRRWFGHILTIPKFVRKEYLSNKKKHAMCIMIEIYKDKKYGAIAEVYERNNFFDRIRETTTEKQRKAFSKALNKIGKSDKPLDTSKWVKPDEESIRNALVESLFALEILKEDSPNYPVYSGKAHVLYAWLHDHSPKNPQSLGNWMIDPYFKSIMAEFKSTEHKKFWRNFNKEFKEDLKVKKRTKAYWKKRQKEYRMWKKNCLKEMIIKDPKPNRFKNVFKELKKKKRK
ncbi:hypothetical protein LCGC14_0556480 [marine sediment metagenome]|uniref:Uncharacterized protein n=1 Tax=marine sediment metagenome TaxID=412755 RepID=A0A0F9RN65_9ZZZZ